MPWWLDNKKLDFPRGYHIEVWGGFGMPSYGFMGGIQRYPDGGGYGASLEGQLSQVLGHHHRLLRSRRDDPNEEATASSIPR